MTRPRKVGYVVSQELVKVSSFLPSNKNRSYLVHSLIKSLGLLSPPAHLIRPRLATVQELCAYHDPDFVDFILDGRGSDSRSAAEFGLEDDCPPFPGLGNYVRLVAGATLAAVEALKNDEVDVAICWDGGRCVRLSVHCALIFKVLFNSTKLPALVDHDGYLHGFEPHLPADRHHAQKARAAGFCYVADCILAILSLKRAPPLPRPSHHSPTSIPGPVSAASFSKSPVQSKSQQSGNDLVSSDLDSTKNEQADAELSRTQSNDKPCKSHVGRKKCRIMYLDLDLHFSDGVSLCFHNPSSPYTSSSSQQVSQILTLSIHYAAPGFYSAHPLASLPSPPSPSASSPFASGARTDFDPFCLSLPLRAGASSRTFRRIWKVVEDVKEAYDPDYVILQCGCDGLAGDPYGVWNWSCNTSSDANAGRSDNGSAISDSVGVGDDRENKAKEEQNDSCEGSSSEEGTLDWCVSRVINEWDVKVLLLGGGGYNSPNTARAWASLTSVALGRPLTPSTPIPSSDHPAFPLYAPSFTLEVPVGHMRDENTEVYLSEVESVYRDVVGVLKERC